LRSLRLAAPPYASAATFHPVFLYELVWDLALAAVLVRAHRARRIPPPGLFALHVAGYSAGRMRLELLRVDPPPRPPAGLPA
jgi:prolipoprotein diacylglyceryltransferase